MKNIANVEKLLFIVIALWTGSSAALVRPVPADIDVQPWMASIYLVNDDLGLSIEVCQGSLIDPRWVLSTIDCFEDYTQQVPGIIWQFPGTEFAVSLGSSETKLSVKTYEVSDNAIVVMFELEEASQNQVIALSAASYESLVDEPIAIFATKESESIKDYYFNETGLNTVYCTVNGDIFVTDDAVCYVASNPIASDSLLVANGTIIDPESSGAPDSVIDTRREFHSDGSRLYIDFRQTNSHACFEDVGAPIVSGSEGEFEQVGIVITTAPFAGLVCNPALTNYFAGLAPYRDFIDGVIAQTAFSSICPAAPSMSLEEIGETGVAVSWEEVSGANGYKLILTDALGYSPLVELDLGNITQASADVDPETEYTLKVLAYNAQCTSGFSNTITINLGLE